MPVDPEVKKAKRRAAYQRLRERNPNYYRDYQRRNKDKIHRNQLKHLFGLTPVDVELMFANQSGLCACCMDPISLIHGAKNYRHIDHNHTTGEVRGLLCGHCNWGLGNFRDDPNRLALAIRYLQRGV